MGVQSNNVSNASGDASAAMPPAEARTKLGDLMDVMGYSVDLHSPLSVINEYLAAGKRVLQMFGLAEPWSDGNTTNDSEAAAIRMVILDAIDAAVRVRAIGLAHGFILPDDPFVTLIAMNKKRKLFEAPPFDPTTMNDLIVSAIDLVKIASAYDAGTIKFVHDGFGSQMKSYEVSVDGISTQTGDPLADILGYQPDGDFIKRKRAIDALARLDFTKRKPYILFILDRDTPRRRSSSIICWSRMRDASGYVVSRTESVPGWSEPVSIRFTNDEIRVETETVKKYPPFISALSYYDWLGPDDFFALVDTTIAPDRLYSYQVEAFQVRSQSSTAIFDVPRRLLSMTPAQLVAVESAFVDTKNPYSALSRVVYGSTAYDWMLAGCNTVQASMNDDDSARNFGYVGSTLEELKEAAMQSKLVAPNDIKDIESAVVSSIASVGVSQTLLSIFDGVGLTKFVAGKDDPLGFKPTEQTVQSVTGGLARIVSAIDPETATVDPSLLVTSLTVAAIGATDLSSTADSGMQFELKNKALIDLTTVTGINRLLDLIRTFYDFYPASLLT